MTEIATFNTQDRPGTTQKRGKLIRHFRILWPLYVMLIPGLIHLFLLSYYPMYGIVIAFQNYKPAMGFARSQWVGLKQFRLMLDNPNFWQVFRNTVQVRSSVYFAAVTAHGMRSMVV